MKYKVGDKVRIKSIDWYNKNKDEVGVVLVENGDYMFCKSDTEWCGKIVTIKEVCLNEYYKIVEDFGKYKWTDGMIEGLVEEDGDLIPKFGEFSDNEPLDIPTMTTDFIKEHGLPCPEGYIFKDENGNIEQMICIICYLILKQLLNNVKSYCNEKI